MDKDKGLGILAILITVLIWGISFINIKIAVAVIGPMTLGLLRFIIATVLLWALKRYKEPQSRLKKKDFLPMVWTGFIGITLYFFFENNGVKLVSPGSAAIIIAAIPIASVIAETAIHKKPLSLKLILSAFLSVIGVGLVTGVAPAVGDNPLGYWYMGGAVLVWVMYTLVSKPLFQRYSSLAITYYQTVVGTILFVPVAIFENTQWALITPVIWINVVILGVFASAIGFYLYLMAMDKLGISVSSLYLNLIPIFTLIFSVLFMKDTVSWGQLGGAALVITAVVSAGRK